MGKISDNGLKKVKRLYYGENLSMQEIADTLGVSLNAVVYFMRKNNLARRNHFETNKLVFEKKKPTFAICQINSQHKKELEIIGAMLYWGEGHKGEKSGVVDFANSDPEMIGIFLNFIREIYSIDENKLRVLLYCYSDQNIAELIKFWSGVTKIPKLQFTKPYIKENTGKNSRKMKYGLVHIRYNDKKLLIELKNLINKYKVKFA